MKTLKAQKVDRGWALAGNAIIVDTGFNTVPDNPKGGQFTVTIDGCIIYEGRFTPLQRIDLSEIAASYIPYFPDIPDDNDSPIVNVVDMDDLLQYKMNVLFEFDGDDGVFECHVIPGAIPPTSFRMFSDPFENRFFNSKSQFFLTTRSISWLLPVKETELAPLYFVQDSTPPLRVIDPVTGWGIDDALSPGVYALDIAAVRKKIYETHNVLVNSLDIYVDEDHSCRIIIERSDPALERYRIKFRNSLGVFEIIEMAGSLDFSRNNDDDSESNFSRYDYDTGRFTAAREPQDYTISALIDSGIKRPDEIPFLLDMLRSDEVYLLDLVDVPIRVIPSAEEVQFRHLSESPRSIPVRLDFVDDNIDIFNMPCTGKEGMKPRIFNNTFNDKFN